MAKARTTVFAVQHLGRRLKSGKLENIVGIPTSFQAENLARKSGIPQVMKPVMLHLEKLGGKLEVRMAVK